MAKRIALMATVALVMAAMMAVGALPVLAQPAPPVGPHQHYLYTGNGNVVRVGPNVCTANENASRQGFFNFHDNVHRGDNPTNVDARGCTAPPPLPM